MSNVDTVAAFNSLRPGASPNCIYTRGYDMRLVNGDSGVLARVEFKMRLAESATWRGRASTSEPHFGSWPVSRVAHASTSQAPIANWGWPLPMGTF